MKRTITENTTLKKGHVLSIKRNCLC